MLEIKVLTAVANNKNNMNETNDMLTDVLLHLYT